MKNRIRLPVKSDVTTWVRVINMHYLRLSVALVSVMAISVACSTAAIDRDAGIEFLALPAKVTEEIVVQPPYQSCYASTPNCRELYQREPRPCSTVEQCKARARLHDAI
jgi:hypothetical protein